MKKIIEPLRSIGKVNKYSIFYQNFKKQKWHQKVNLSKNLPGSL